MDEQNFIYCLEVVADVEEIDTTAVTKILEDVALKQNISSIYKPCDSIEGLQESLSFLLYNDHNFKDYEIIYLVLEGEANTILINNYYYTFQEIAELFEGQMQGKVIHFANTKLLDLEEEEFQYFLDVTGARAVSGYGHRSDIMTSAFTLDRVFFSLFYQNENLLEVVETMFQKHYKLCKLLDFRLYY